MRVRATVLVFLRLRARAVSAVSWKPMETDAADDGAGLTSLVVEIIDPIHR